MICPLVWPGRITEETGKEGTYDCLHQECAWWDEQWHCCGLLSIGDELARLAHNILVASGHEPPAD